MPSREEHRRRFAALPTAERRSIVRAVNKGRAVERRKHAPLAVGVARQQQRFWRWAWLAGPLIGLVQLGSGWQAAVLNAAVGALLMGGVSAFWVRRAHRAETANLERLGRKKRR